MAGVKRGPTSNLVQKALRAWHRTSSQHIGLFDLRTFRSNETATLSRRKAGYKTLEMLITELSEHDPEHSRLLLERFVLGEKITQVAAKRNMSVDHVNRLQRAAIERLTAVIAEREGENVQALQDSLLAQLQPASYSFLAGRDELIEEVATLLRESDGPRLIELVGIGGLGKTAVARAVAELLIRDQSFDRVSWLQAEADDNEDEILERLHTSLGGEGGPKFLGLRELRKTLKNLPRLVIVDNLLEETKPLSLFHKLADLSGPSRFLLTGRVYPPPLADVYTIPVSELSETNAVKVVIEQFKLTGLDLRPGVNEAARVLSKHVGGNPLALKLAVTLMHFLPQEKVLDALSSANSIDTERLFKSIYWKTWSGLPETNKRTLLSTLLFNDDGGRFEQIQATSVVTDRELNDALLSLTRLSLLELRKRGNDARYATHRLTRNFLQMQVKQNPQGFSQLVNSNLVYWQECLLTRGPDDLLAVEGANMIRAAEIALDSGHMENAGRLLVSLHPGLRSEWNLRRWAKVYERACSSLGGAMGPWCILYYHVGTLWLRLGEHDKAIECFDQASKAQSVPLSPTISFFAAAGKAMSFFLKGEPKSARLILHTIHREKPDLEAYVLCIHGLFSYWSSHWQSADKKFTAALGRTPKSQLRSTARLRVYRGLTLMKLAKTRAALKQFRLATECLTAQPNAMELAQVELLRSCAFFQVGDLANAQAALERAQATTAGQSTHRAFYETSLGRLSLMNKKTAEAADFLKGAAILWKKLGQPSLAADTAALLLLATSDDSAGS